MNGAIRILLCSLAAGCGAAGSAPDPLVPDEPKAAVCTGPAPANAAPCPGSGGAPVSDTPRYVTPACSGQPCSFGCSAGHVVAGGACVDGTPAPRPTAVLTDAGDGTLVDRDTGVRWLRNPGCAETVQGAERRQGTAGFHETRAWLSRLADGSCGLSDGSGPGDWHLPSEAELLGLVGASSLFDRALAGPSWSSMEPCSTTAITVDPGTGEIGERSKDAELPAWPVRRP